MARLNIPRELAKNSILQTALHGVRTVLERETGLKNILISTDDKVKLEMKNQGNTAYPYAWLAPSDAQIVKDQVSNRATQAYGMRMGGYGATRNTSRVGFLFPVRLGFELKYTDDDAMRMMRMVETFLLLSAVNRLTFDIRFANSMTLNTRIEIPDSTTIPIADTGDTTKPGGSEVSVALIIHTYAGFVRDVSSVYAADPTIGYVINKDVPTGTLAAPSETSAEDFPDYITQLPEEFTSNAPPNSF